MWGATDTSSRIRLLLPPAARPGGARGQGRGSPVAPGGPERSQQGLTPGLAVPPAPPRLALLVACARRGLGKPSLSFCGQGSQG